MKLVATTVTPTTTACNTNQLTDLESNNDLLKDEFGNATDTPTINYYLPTMKRSYNR